MSAKIIIDHSLSCVEEDKNTENKAECPAITQKWEKHPYWLFRATYLILHSTWLSAVAISGAIAWTISLLLI